MGRWLSIDPKASRHPNESPYNYVLNNPIYLVDKLGETEDVYITIIDRTGHKMTIHMPQSDAVLKIPYYKSIRLGPDGDFLAIKGTKEYNTVYTVTFSYEGVKEGDAPKMVKSALYTSEVGDKGWSWRPVSGGAIESDLGGGEPKEWSDLVGLLGGGKMGAKSMGESIKGALGLIGNLLKTYKSFEKVFDKLNIQSEDLKKMDKTIETDTMCSGCGTQGDHGYGFIVTDKKKGDTLLIQDQNGKKELKKN